MSGRPVGFRENSLRPEHFANLVTAPGYLGGKCTRRSFVRLSSRLFTFPPATRTFPFARYIVLFDLRPSSRRPGSVPATGGAVELRLSDLTERLGGTETREETLPAGLRNSISCVASCRMYCTLQRRLERHWFTLQEGSLVKRSVVQLSETQQKSLSDRQSSRVSTVIFILNRESFPRL